MVIMIAVQLFSPQKKEAGMKRLGKILTLFTLAGGLLALATLFCRYRRRRRRSSYVKLYEYDT